MSTILELTQQEKQKSAFSRNKNQSVQVVPPSAKNSTSQSKFPFSFHQSDNKTKKLNNKVSLFKIFEAAVKIPVFDYDNDQEEVSNTVPFSSTQINHLNGSLTDGNNNNDNHFSSSIKEFNANVRITSSDDNNNLSESQLLFESPQNTDSNVIAKSTVPLVAKKPIGRPKGSTSKTTGKKITKVRVSKKNTTVTAKAKSKTNGVNCINTQLSPTKLSPQKSYSSKKFETNTVKKVSTVFAPPPPVACAEVNTKIDIVSTTRPTENRSNSIDLTRDDDTTVTTTDLPNDTTNDTTIFEFVNLDDDLDTFQPPEKTKKHTYFNGLGLTNAKLLFASKLPDFSGKKSNNGKSKTKEQSFQSVLQDTTTVSKKPIAKKKVHKIHKIRKPQTKSKQAVLPFGKTKMVTRSVFRSLSEEEQTEIEKMGKEGVPVKKNSTSKSQNAPNSKSREGVSQESNKEDEIVYNVNSSITREVVHVVDLENTHFDAVVPDEEEFIDQDCLFISQRSIENHSSFLDQSVNNDVITPIRLGNANVRDSSTPYPNKQQTLISAEPKIAEKKVVKNTSDKYFNNNKPKSKIDNADLDILKNCKDFEKEIDFNFIQLNEIIDNSIKSQSKEEEAQLNTIPHPISSEIRSDISKNLEKLQNKMDVMSKKHSEISSIIQENHELLKKKLDQKFAKLTRLHDSKILSFFNMTDLQLSELITNETNVITTVKSMKNQGKPI